MKKGGGGKTHLERGAAVVRVVLVRAERGVAYVGFERLELDREFVVAYEAVARAELEKCGRQRGGRGGREGVGVEETQRGEGSERGRTVNRLIR